MAESRHCPRCHSEIPLESLDGLCPNCLFQLTLESTTETFTLLEGDATLPAPRTSMPTSQEIRRLGDYELIDEIARGGMGVVYRARQLSLNRTVALKLMRPGSLASEAEVQRFLAEAEAAASLQHPNIVAIHEVGAQDGLQYFSMDYVEGQTLAETIREGPLSSETAARYVKTIAEAIDYAHQRGILHRDLKPSNVLIDHSGTVRITDFGLAKRITEDSGLTASGAVMGTPSYMPPEQASGHKAKLAPASDVYALGAILYDLLTGRPPFQAETSLDTLLLVINSDPVAPRQLNPKLARDLETICLKCLEKEPRKRYTTAQELADDLDRFLKREPIRARPISFVNRGWRWCRRNPWPTVAAVALVILVTVFSISAITYRERLWQALVEQVRTERLAGNRAKSLERAAEAARIKSTPELRQEAIQTLIRPGMRLLHEFPGGSQVGFSPDGRIAFATSDGKTVFREMKSGRQLATIEYPEGFYVNSPASGDEGIRRDTYSSALSPTVPLLAQAEITVRITRNRVGGMYILKDLTIEDETVGLWDTTTGQKIAAIRREDTLGLRRTDAPGFNRKEHTQSEQVVLSAPASQPLFFSHDGMHLAQGDWSGRVWIIDVRNHRGEIVHAGGEVRGFLSNDELLLSVGGQLRKWNVTTKESRVASPMEASYLATSANLGSAAFRTRGNGRSKETVIILDVMTGGQVGLLPDVPPSKSRVLLSNDGRFVAMHNPAQPNVIELWRTTVETNQRLAIALPSNSTIHFGTDETGFSPDGSMLAATVNEAGKFAVRLWDTDTGGEVAVVSGSKLAWSGDGRLLATLDARNFVQVWAITPPTPAYLLPEQVTTLAFSTDGKQLVSGESLLDVVRTSEQPYLRPSSQQFPRGKILTNGSQLWAVPVTSYPIKLSQLAPQKQELTLEDPGYSFFKPKDQSIPPGSETNAIAGNFAISPDGKVLVMSCIINVRFPNPNGGMLGFIDSQQVLEMWDLVGRKRLAVLNREDMTQGITYIRFSPDGKLAATCGEGQRLNIWNGATGEMVHRVDLRQRPHVAAFSPDSNLLFSAGKVDDAAEGAITVIETKTGRERGFWKGHRGSVLGLAISSDGRLLASGGTDSTVRLWDTATGRELARWVTHLSNVTALAFSPDGKTLASGSADGVLKLWDIPFIRRELSALGLDW